jgi:ketosteroid isomerase-like protein
MKIPVQAPPQEASRSSLPSGRRICLICLLLFCGVTAPILSSQQTDTASTIRLLERQWTEAHTQNDNQTLALIIDNAIVYIEYGRMISKGDYLARIKNKSSGSDDVVMEPLTVRVFGQTAIVIGSYREIQRSGGKRTLKRWRFVDTWTYKKDGWVLIAAASAPMRVSEIP